MEPLWLRYYPDGVPKTINPDVYISLNDMFEQIFFKYKNLPAFINMDQVLTFDQLDLQSQNFAAFLQNKLGVVKGDRVAIMMPNLLQYPIAMIGALRAGAIVVNVNTLSTYIEFTHQMQDSEATILVVSENLAHIPSSEIDSTNIKHVIVTKISDQFAQPKALIIDFMVKYIKHLVPKWKLQKYYKFKSVINEGGKLTLTKIEVSNQDVAFLQYSGGTTGTPKAAMLSHRNLQSQVMITSAWMKAVDMTQKQIFFGVLPIFTVAATNMVMLFMYLGAINLLTPNPRDAKTLVKLMKKHKITAIAGINSLYNLLLSEPDLSTVDFSNLKIAVSGGMALQQTIEMRWKHIAKNKLISTYGATETANSICSDRLDEQEFTGTVGLPLPSTEVSVRNERGEEVGIDYPGEIWVRGPQVMLGYWRQEKETQKALTPDGWFKTGDVGIMNDKGHVRIIDRIKDVILSYGYLVYPSEVEEIISMIPEVKEVAIVDASDQVDEEFIKAFIVPRDASLTKEKVLMFCVKNLPYYKVPKDVEFRESLPKNMLGKILRRSLRSGQFGVF